VASIQDLQRQLRIMNERNKDLLRQLKQQNQVIMEESNQNVCNFNIILKEICIKIKS